MRVRLISVLAVTAGVALSGITAAVLPAQAVTSKIQIIKVKYDSTGRDLPETNKKVNDEWVQIQNTDRTVTRAITKWTLRDRTGFTHTFGKTVLKPGQVITVRTGRGDNTLRNKYWGRDYYVWNNTGDTAYLRDASGKGGDTCSWTDGNGTKVC